MNFELFIERLKLTFNVSTDSDLSRKLGKTPGYIAQCRIRKTIDYELVLENCNDIDLNWLLIGESYTKKKIYFTDPNGNRIEATNEVNTETASNTKPNSIQEILKEKDLIILENQKQLSELQHLLAKYQLKDMEK